jgi:hypothetical protein
MATFDYRRELTARELVPAIGVGIGAGVVVAYVAQLLLRRQRLPRAAERASLPAPSTRAVPRPRA